MNMCVASIKKVKHLRGPAYQRSRLFRRSSNKFIRCFIYTVRDVVYLETYMYNTDKFKIMKFSFT